MRVLVTGATGFIGGHVASALVDAGHEVRVTVRQASNTRWIEELPVQRVTADLRVDLDLRRVVEGVEAVVDVAGLTRSFDPKTLMEVNAGGARRLAEAAAAAGVHTFVLVSSLAARGPDQAQVDGDAPVSWYGLSKLQAERAAAAVAERTGMRVVALRLGGVYGPRDTDLLPLFRSAARGFLPLPPGGLRVQPVHVDDVVRAVTAALGGDADFGPWVVAEGTSYDWDEIGTFLKGALDRRVVTTHLPRGIILAAARASECWASLRRGAPRLDLRRAEDLALFSYTDDVDATRRALGWDPRVSLPEGLRATVAWYRDVGWLP